MPECVACICGQEDKYFGVHMRVQEEMPTGLRCMDEAEYEELRRVVSQGLEPANRRIARTNSWWVLRFLTRMPVTCIILLFFGTLVPSMFAALAVPGLSRKARVWTASGGIAACCLMLLAVNYLRQSKEAYIDRHVAHAMIDVHTACREFSRGKRFRVVVKAARVSVDSSKGRCPEYFTDVRTEYFLKITRVLDVNLAESSSTEAGARPPSEAAAAAAPQEGASVAAGAEVKQKAGTAVGEDGGDFCTAV